MNKKQPLVELIAVISIFLFGCATPIQNIPVNYEFSKDSKKAFIYGRVNLEGASGFSVNLIKMDSKKRFKYEVSSSFGMMEMDDRDFAVEIEPGNWTVRSISKKFRGNEAYSFQGKSFLAEPGIGYFIGDVEKSEFDTEMKLAYPTFNQERTVDLKLKF